MKEWRKGGLLPYNNHSATSKLDLAFPLRNMNEKSSTSHQSNLSAVVSVVEVRGPPAGIAENCVRWCRY